MTLLAALLIFVSGASATELRVLSFNAAGVPVVHAKIDQRMHAIGEELARGGYDVVALQEVWRDSDAELLYRASGLPHRARARQRWPFGDGLLILSRFPILESDSLSFSARTRRWLALDGEQLAHKGAVLARIDAPGGPLDVYATHFVADYKRYRNEEVRRRQAAELAEWITKRSQGRPMLLAGDFNIRSGTPEESSLASALGLRDICLDSGRESCGDSRRPARIDYILVPEGSPRAPQARLALESSIVVSGRSYPISDHPAVEALLPMPGPMKVPAVPLAGK